MAMLVLTAIGVDREGLVQALSTAVDQHGGNWLESQFARLAGKFAGIALVEVPADQADAFHVAVAGLQDAVGLRVEITAGEAERHPTSEPVAADRDRPLQLHLLGQDRPGTVRQVTSALVAQQVTIIEFSSWAKHAPEGDGLLFEAAAVIQLPPGGDVEAVRAALEGVANELMVDIEVN